MECPFCAPEKKVAENELALALRDTFPVAPGHCLVIPKRHITGLDEVTPEEAAALLALIRETKKWIRQRHPADGFTVGVNDGPAAGQTVMHLHVHVIPRVWGDVLDPRGGVRKVLLNRHRSSQPGSTAG